MQTCFRQRRRVRHDGVMAATPRTYAQLQQALQRLDTFSPGQARIARLVLRDPESCAFRTIGETARLAEVHESTVVRFATSLGLSGYPALVALCRERLRERAQLIGRFDNAATVGESPDELLDAVASQDAANITRTYAQLDRGVWDKTVGWLAEAPRVHVAGMRKCYTVAYLTAYLLRLVRRDVTQIGTVPGNLVEELRDMSSDDVLVAISIHRYSRETVTAARYAASKGARVVAMTDDAGSPLAAVANACFYAETGGVTVLRSVTSFISLAQALATATAVRLGTRTRQALLLDETLLGELGVYTNEEDG